MTVNPVIYNIYIKHNLDGSINRLYRSNHFKTKTPVKITLSKMDIWRKIEITTSICSVTSLAVGIVNLFKRKH